MQLSLCNYDFPQERQRFHPFNESEVIEKFRNQEKEREREREREREKQMLKDGSL